MYFNRFMDASSIRMKTMFGFSAALTAVVALAVAVVVALTVAVAVAVALAVALRFGVAVVVAGDTGMAVDTAADRRSGLDRPDPINVRDASTRNAASKYLGRRLLPSAIVRTPPR
jgi:hypothetical protein